MSGKAATRLDLRSAAAALKGSDGYLPGLPAMGMQPEQQGVGWRIAEPPAQPAVAVADSPLPRGAACNATGRWLNPANGIFVDIVQTGAGTLVASCEGGKGWKGAKGNLTAPTQQQPQGGFTFRLPASPKSAAERASFGVSAATNAPPCSEITFTPSNKWCREPFCAAGPPVVPSWGAPHVQAFSEGNGNEHRLSFHGFAKGFAQLIHSPTTWANNPMIINTNKRITNDTSPGPMCDATPRH